MKLRTKLLSGFSFVVILGVIIGIAGLMATQTLTRMTGELSALENTGTGVNTILNAHYVWRQGITETALGGKEFTGSLDPSSCALGKWKVSHEAQSITDPEALALIQKIDEPHNFIHRNAQTILDDVEAGNMLAAAEKLDELLPRTMEVIEGLTQLQERFADLAHDKNDEILAQGTQLTIIIIVVIVVAATAGILLALYISASITKPLSTITGFMKQAGSTGDITLSPEDTERIGKLSKMKDEIGQLSSSTASFIQHVTNVSAELETIADGDLTAEVKILSDRDTLGRSLTRMTENLSNMFGEIRASTEQVNDGAKQIAKGSQALAQGSTQQAASIQELSSSIQEISEETKQSADKAGKAASLAGTIKEKAEKGSRQMNDMIAAVSDINDASQSISKVIKTIDDIAFQTNILALNAAVEAARAGQHGKGFAVVAEEVRSLAGKSAEAARETSEMIENSISKSNAGVQIAGETAESLSEIVSGINESTQIVEEIAKSSDGQSEFIKQVNIGIEQVAQVVSQNSATAQESAASSEQMSGQSSLLQDLISQFRLKESGTKYSLTD